MTVEFTCEGCGVDVRLFGADAIPRHQLCGICLFVCEHIPADQIMQVRRQVEPGGWIIQRPRARV